MGDPFQKVVPGERLHIPARAWNEFLAARDPGYDQEVETHPVMHAVWVRNDSGSNRERFEILGLDVPIVLPTSDAEEFKARAMFSGVTPNTTTHATKFAILQEPLPAGGIGKALIFGVAITQISVSGSDLDWAAPATGSYKLANGTTGAVRILWIENSGATRWAIVGVGFNHYGSNIIKYFQESTYFDAQNGVGLNGTYGDNLTAHSDSGLTITYDFTSPITPGGKRFYIAASAASPTQWGVATNALQTFGGRKHFYDGIQFYHDTPANSIRWLLHDLSLNELSNISYVDGQYTVDNGLELRTLQHPSVDTIDAGIRVCAPGGGGSAHSVFWWRDNLGIISTMMTVNSQPSLSTSMGVDITNTLRVQQDLYVLGEGYFSHSINGTINGGTW